MKRGAEKGQAHNLEQERCHKVRLIRWFFFGIFFSFVPILISLIVNWYIGYQNNTTEVIVKYFVDFVLVIFAVATNACSYATEGKIRIFLMILSIAAMTISGIEYVISLAVPSENIFVKIIPSIIVATILLIISASVGFLAEREDHKNGQNLV